MRRESVISIGLALASHAVVLFGVPAILLRPAVKSPEPAYIEVSLAAAPPDLASATPTDEPEPQVPQPAPLPTPKPEPETPPPKQEPHEPAPVVPPSEPEDLKPPEPTPAPTPPATPPQIAPASKPDSAPASLAHEGAQAASINAITNQASVSSEYHLLSQPYYVKRGQARYPLEAKKLRQEGTVVLTLYINALGKLDKIEVNQSSGFPLLDEAAIAAEHHSRFRPAYRGNRPVACRAEVPYRFVLPR